MTDIQCSFASQGSNLGDIITAKLKKPIGFKGAPLFADDRAVNPEADVACGIKQDRKDPSELSYDLKITDFSRCGVLKRNVSYLYSCGILFGKTVPGTSNGEFISFQIQLFCRVSSTYESGSRNFLLW